MDLKLAESIKVCTKQEQSLRELKYKNVALHECLSDLSIDFNNKMDSFINDMSHDDEEH